MSASIKMARMQAQGRAMPGTGYRGDPGLFGFLGKVAKGVTGVVGGLGIPGISTVASFANRGLTAVIGGKTAKTRQLAQASTGVRTFGGPSTAGRFASTLGFQLPTPGLRGVAERAIPGGATGFEDAPKGYHVNKTGYFLKTGEYIPPGTRWVRDRKRNPLNPRAWDRAYGRLKSANNFKKRMAKVTFKKTCCT